MGPRSRLSASAAGESEDQQIPNEFFISKRPRKPIKLQMSVNGSTNTVDGMEGSDDIEESLEDTRQLSTKRRQSGRNQRNMRSSDTVEGRTIFIKNVSFDADEDQLYQFLSNFGKLMFVKIVKDKLTQHPRGTAFAKFESRADVESILLQASKPEVCFFLWANFYRFLVRFLTNFLWILERSSICFCQQTIGFIISC